jgi:hypothetical protein
MACFAGLLLTPSIPISLINSSRFDQLFRWFLTLAL